MSFPRYPKYKASGVEWLGEVPEHWEVKRLRFAADFNPPKSELSYLHEETLVSFLPMEAIGEDGSLNLDKEKTIGELEGGYTYFRDGDIAFAKITPCYENGKGALMRGLTNGIGFGTTELIVARPKPNQTVGNYLHYLFISRDFRSIGESHMYGAGGQKRVPDAFVRNFATALPPLPEQTAIAEFLDRETGKIDELVAEQRRLMELLKEKRQAVISHAVTKGLNPHAPMKPSGIEWLGDVPARWEVIQLRRLVTEHRQGYYSTDPYVESGIKLLRITDLGDSGEVNYDTCPQVEDRGDVKEFILRTGDFVFARTGGAGSFGLIGLIYERVAYASYLIRFRFCSGALPRFMRFFFLSAGFKGGIQRDIHGGVNQNVHAQDIKNQVFALPPVDEQNAVADFLEAETAKFDTLAAEAQRAIDLLQERRTALISAAVTGRIDVRAVR